MLLIALINSLSLSENEFFRMKKLAYKLVVLYSVTTVWILVHSVCVMSEVCSLGGVCELEEAPTAAGQVDLNIPPFQPPPLVFTLPMPQHSWHFIPFPNLV